MNGPGDISCLGDNNSCCPLGMLVFFQEEKIALEQKKKGMEPVSTDFRLLSRMMFIFLTKAAISGFMRRWVHRASARNGREGNVFLRFGRRCKAGLGILGILTAGINHLIPLRPHGQSRGSGWVYYRRRRRGPFIKYTLFHSIMVIQWIG